MGKSRTGKIAAVCAAVAFIFTLLAFSTPEWLVNDGRIEDPKFSNIGLWVACFQNYREVRHWYDTQFTGCWWVFEEEYYIIHNILLPGFFVATQFFYTLTFTLMLIAIFLVTLYLSCSKSNSRFVLLLFVIGSDLLLAAISGTIAVVIFGARGDGRDWMPHWEHNDIGWSYAMAVMGVLFLYISGMLYMIEGRRQRRKQNDEYNGRGDHQIETKTSRI